MDLSRPIVYRGVDFNSVVLSNGSPISGIAMEQVLFSGAPGIGYSEKRSLTDGYDASDVYLGKRGIRARATAYGSSRADLFDTLQSIMAALHPTAAYLEDVGAKGYLPITYDVPTLDIVNWAEETAGDGYGYRAMQVYARPIGQPDILFDRDRSGGTNRRGLAVPVAWGWDIIDPRTYTQAQQIALINGETSIIDEPITNRGDYPTPVNVLLIVPADRSSGDVTFTLGTSAFTISIPDSTEDQIIRYSAQKKVLTVEEEGEETVRMDLLDLLGEDTHPQILPGVGAFSMISDITFDTNSRLFFEEAYA